MNEQHISDLVDAYALGALEPHEVETVESHLEGCAACRILATEARGTAQLLLFAAPLVEPPLSLRSRVLARVHAEAIRGTAEEAGTVTSASQSKARNWGRVREFVRGLFGPLPLPRDEVASTLLSDLLSQPESVVWELQGTQDAPAARARLVGIPGNRDAVLMTSGLRHLRVDETYQIWFLRDGKPLPNALFNVTRGGNGQEIVRAPTQLGTLDAIAITPEPAGGSAAPTGPIVLMGTLAA